MSSHISHTGLSPPSAKSRGTAKTSNDRTKCGPLLCHSIVSRWCATRVVVLLLYSNINKRIILITAHHNYIGIQCGPSTSCTGVCLAITMFQYYICVGIVLTVVLVLGLGLGFGIICRAA